MMNRIKLDIVFDQEPEDGLRFSEGKIFVNTKDPTLYTQLYQQAIQRYQQDQGL